MAWNRTGAGLDHVPEVAGLAVAVARQNFVRPSCTNLIDTKWRVGFEAGRVETQGLLPYCHGVPGTAEPRDYE